MLYRVCLKISRIVIARSVLCEEAISAVTPGDCFGKKRLAMTGLFVFSDRHYLDLQGFKNLEGLLVY
jgi:hypothetical protein